MQGSSNSCFHAAGSWFHANSAAVLPPPLHGGRWGLRAAAVTRLYSRWSAECGLCSPVCRRSRRKWTSAWHWSLPAGTLCAAAALKHDSPLSISSTPPPRAWWLSKECRGRYPLQGARRQPQVSTVLLLRNLSSQGRRQSLRRRKRSLQHPDAPKCSAGDLSVHKS